jgi:tetratricopeptide (TPR) repeat protein
MTDRATTFRRLATALLPLLLAGCATSWEPPDEPVVETRVRQPAQQGAAGTQVYPLRNPAVIELLETAGAAEQRGDYEQAAALLERALRIQPHNPEVLQQMAEVQLHVRDYQQALNFAVRSYDVGPRVGEICNRNWRTISVAREYLGDRGGAAEAEKRAGSCLSAKPPSL